jgi:hypothetical protein
VKRRRRDEEKKERKREEGREIGIRKGLGIAKLCIGWNDTHTTTHHRTPHHTTPHGQRRLLTCIMNSLSFPPTVSLSS